MPTRPSISVFSLVTAMCLASTIGAAIPSGAQPAPAESPPPSAPPPLPSAPQAPQAPPVAKAQQAPASTPAAQAEPAGAPTVPEHNCGIDLALAGNMSDVLSNTLLRSVELRIARPLELDVRAFLDGAETRFADGPALLAAAASHFKIDPARLAAEVEKFKHCNCGVGRMPDELAAMSEEDALEVSPFAKDVTLHVVLHELAHALIREFDIPILGNEETAADAFATYYLTAHIPDRAVDVLTARVTSLMIEAHQSPGDNWRGEHDHDGRRAFKIAAIAVAADPEKYKPVAEIVGMTEQDIKKASDYGAEVRRSWRRVLEPLWMPQGQTSDEAQVRLDTDSAFLHRLCNDGLLREIETTIKRFDWHSQVTVSFVAGDGGAGWSRSSRTITVHSAYARRFVEQGTRGLRKPE